MLPFYFNCEVKKMTLDEAIKHCEEKAKEIRQANEEMPTDCKLSKELCECANEHEQLAEWLKDYKRLLGERTPGKWIAREDMDYLDINFVYHNHFMCERCGFIHDFLDGHTSQYEYCPKCGTKLKFVWLEKEVKND